MTKLTETQKKLLVYAAIGSAILGVVFLILYLTGFFNKKQTEVVLTSEDLAKANVYTVLTKVELYDLENINPRVALTVHISINHDDVTELQYVERLGANVYVGDTIINTAFANELVNYVPGGSTNLEILLMYDREFDNTTDLTTLNIQLTYKPRGETDFKDWGTKIQLEDSQKRLESAITDIEKTSSDRTVIVQVNLSPISEPLNIIDFGIQIEQVPIKFQNNNVVFYARVKKENDDTYTLSDIKTNVTSNIIEILQGITFETVNYQKGELIVVDNYSFILIKDSSGNIFQPQRDNFNNFILSTELDNPTEEIINSTRFIYVSVDEEEFITPTYSIIERLGTFPIKISDEDGEWIAYAIVTRVGQTDLYNISGIKKVRSYELPQPLFNQDTTNFKFIPATNDPLVEDESDVDFFHKSMTIHQIIDGTDYLYVHSNDFLEYAEPDTVYAPDSLVLVKLITDTEYIIAEDTVVTTEEATTVLTPVV